MEQLLEKVKVQVDRSSVNLPEDRKTLQEFGKIWKVVYEKLKRSPDQVQKYRNLVKRVANSATTGMIDKLAGQYSFMGKLFNVEVDKNKWSEYSPTPWRIAFAGNIGENIVNEINEARPSMQSVIGKATTTTGLTKQGLPKGWKETDLHFYTHTRTKSKIWADKKEVKARIGFGEWKVIDKTKNPSDTNKLARNLIKTKYQKGLPKDMFGESYMNESLITELPHAEYNKEGIEAIDFRIEKLPISQDQKKELVKAFRSGKGIIGFMPKSGKLLKFTQDNIKVLKKADKKDKMLPKDWQKYAVIIRDWRIDMSDKEQLKEIIREVVREILMEKWKDGVDVKSTGEHADKTIAQLKKEIEALKGKPGNKEKMGELLFALRAKQGWKKGKGATGL